MQMTDPDELFLLVVRNDLAKWCLDRKLPDDHGILHFDLVHEHARQACRNRNQLVDLTQDQKMAVELAALLHDVDDPKIAGFVKIENEVKAAHDATPYPIARWFLNKHQVSKPVSDWAIEMIGYVSTSKNGDTIPEAARAPENRWKLIPRAADRIEAIGWRGVRRCQEVTIRIKNPIVTPQTPLPTTKQELKEILAKQSLSGYNGKSESFISHFFDKLLLLECPCPNNPYLMERWEKHMEWMRTWLLRFCSVLKMFAITAPLYPSPDGPLFDMCVAPADNGGGFCF